MNFSIFNDLSTGLTSFFLPNLPHLETPVVSGSFWYDGPSMPHWISVTSVTRQHKHDLPQNVHRPFSKELLFLFMLLGDYNLENRWSMVLGCHYLQCFSVNKTMKLRNIIFSGKTYHHFTLIYLFIERKPF